MSTAVAPSNNSAAVAEGVFIGGDLEKLSPVERLNYYRAVCDSLGLNYLSKPFEYIRLSGRLTLYARKDATDQLRSIHGISVEITSREFHEGLDLYVVTARARYADGRADESIGAVSIKGLQGEALANALMKAETKAKRRVTLSIAGLGWLDETEVSSVPGAEEASVDLQTGEVLPPSPSTEAERMDSDLRARLETEYPWQAELRAELEKAGLKSAQLAIVFPGKSATYERINEYLAEGHTVYDLVSRAADLHAARKG